MISVLPRLAILFCFATVPVWAQLSYAFGTTGPTSLIYNGTQYVDSSFGSNYNGTPWILTYTEPNGGTYSSDFFSCAGISITVTGHTVNGICATWTFHFSYTYSQPDANTLQIAYTLYNDNMTNTISSVTIPSAAL
jgi:hypothetical protein